jgi:cystathionine beta-lyase
MVYSFDQIIPREGTHAYKLDLREKVFGNPDVLPLWVADMDFAAPPQVMNAIQQRAMHGIYGYTVRGDWFQQAIVGWMQRRHQWTVNPAWVEYAPGVVPSMVMAVLAYTQPGDQVVIQTPVYPPFYSVVRDNGRELITNPLLETSEGYVMDFDLLEQQLANPNAKMFFLCHPHNPVGRVWRRDELERLANLCLQYDVLMVSDEIHSDLILFGNHHIPLASLSAEVANRTITLNAASKTFNIAGFSTSYVVIPNAELMAQYRKVLTGLHLYTGHVFSGISLEAAYTHGEPWLNDLLLYLESNIAMVQDFLAKRLPEVTFHQPQATFLLWLDFRAWKMSQHELKHTIIHKANVGLNDGVSFGNEGQGFMRLNVGSPRALVLEGLERIAKARNV